MARRAIVGFAAAGLLAAALPALTGWPAAKSPATPLALTAADSAFPSVSDVLQNPALHVPGAVIEIPKTLTLKKGDTLFDLLSRAGAAGAEANAAIAALAKTQNPKKLNAGQAVRIVFVKTVGTNEAPSLSRLVIPSGFGKELVVEKGESGFASRTAEAEAMPVKAYAEGVIEDSLYLAALREGVPLPVVAEMIRLFSFDVDFQRDIWAGDSFRLYYERALARDGAAEPDGRILAASLNLRGKELAYFRFTDAAGGAEYYTAEGNSARKMLMKTPIDGARLSSRYGMRKHPILGYNRMHKGMDFAAPTGTPIYAAGNGVIEKAGAWGTYGNYIRIRHNSTYSTAYGHLSKYASGVKSGTRVRQGQVIGYVGATGGATGPHLHYEILVNGGQVNPSTLRFPKDKSLSGSELAAFRLDAAASEREQDAIRGLWRVAAAASAPGAPSP